MSSVEKPRGARRFNRPGDHGLATEQFDVLARDTFTTAAGGDDGDFHTFTSIGLNFLRILHNKTGNYRTMATHNLP